MEAPEKIYIYPSDRAGEEYEDEWGDKPWGEDCVEYIRKDVSIKKVIKYLYDNNKGFILTEKDIDDLRKYMED